MDSPFFGAGLDVLASGTPRSFGRWSGVDRGGTGCGTATLSLQ